MELQLVTFEQAKNLKKLGFPQDYDDAIYIVRDCFSLNGNSKESHKEGDLIYNPSGFSLQDWISAPSLELACKWFRDEKRLHVFVEYKYNSTPPYYFSRVFGYLLHPFLYGYLGEGKGTYSTYENALSAGIDKAIGILL